MRFAYFGSIFVGFEYSLIEVRALDSHSLFHILSIVLIFVTFVNVSHISITPVILPHVLYSSVYLEAKLFH